MKSRLVWKEKTKGWVENNSLKNFNTHWQQQNWAIIWQKLLATFLIDSCKISIQLFIRLSVHLGVKGQKWHTMKNNYIHHMPYLRNSIAYDHDFWYTIVK